MGYKVLLVEDQTIVRNGLKMMIEQDEQFSVIAEAENGEQAIVEMERHIVDIVIMDIRMPIMNGIEATRIIKKKWEKVHVLILTTFNDDEYAVQALREGADGFLLKSADADKLIKAIHSCLQGGMAIHEEVAAKMVPRLLKKSSTEHKQPFTLSERELAITKLVGEGKTNKEIAEQLYLTVGTIKNHISQILHKLELRDRTQLAIFAVKNDLA
ncbi:DNA-binding NarL/FixJ family response regulator [Salirhabdus euzebyi]|uniref:DNA-binding NarL/FixJ family response regulator n=1 Tax=Salirhabdus euzebyi TaxID=394506 RepID=A0A841Q9T4_9BACI|nr:response regulator transcription factor [Salirhabdus euzebyi]MBB6455063.1 DNA-binding NarL/FixJ family response regulator [Salirhabdus euzebyi]